MLKWFKRFFKDDETIQRLYKEQAELRKNMSEMFDAIKTITEEKAKLEQELQAARSVPGPDREEYHSKEPWIEIVSESFDEEKGIQIALDWNTAFVEYLKENGFQGQNEDEIVRLYLAFLYRDIVERIETDMEATKTPQPQRRSNVIED